VNSKLFNIILDQLWLNLGNLNENYYKITKCLLYQLRTLDMLPIFVTCLIKQRDIFTRNNLGILLGRKLNRDFLVEAEKILGKLLWVLKLQKANIIHP